MFIRRLFVVVTTLIIPTFAMADNENVTTFMLDNGMQGVVIEDHRAPVVTHMVWYKVGAADEAPGKSGIAHFLEHLLFKGTDKMEAGEFSQIVAANGGSENAFTNQDYTGYFQRIAADRLPLMMELESDRMQGLKLTQEEVLPERDVIIEERNSRTESNPSALFSEHRTALMYDNHPYGIPVIGWMHEMQQLSREDALAFYKTYYAPNNAILIVAGDVEPDEVKELAQNYYGALTPSTTIPERVRPAEPPHRAAVRTVFEDPRVRQPYVIRNYAATNRKAGDQKEAAALTLFVELFGGSGVTSFMGQRMQLDKKISINQAAFYDGVSYDPTSLGIYAVPAPGVGLTELESELDATIAAFLEEGVDTDHLARLKTQIAASEIYALDDQSGLARRYGEALTAGLTIEDVQGWSDALQAVTPDDIMNAARNVLNDKASVTGWLVADKESAK
ncbi:peptidase M16 [Amylibacter ulvae]|uniref:Peptidase M16 n=1 Tax=Paramylibacter ulvae TaxID=1651968 RepID=A0ABQ3D6Y2_9RHOB|nr:peptidase M16 [Amylibacter ulvae]